MTQTQTYTVVLERPENSRTEESKVYVAIGIHASSPSEAVKSAQEEAFFDDMECNAESASEYKPLAMFLGMHAPIQLP